MTSDRSARPYHGRHRLFRAPAKAPDGATGCLVLASGDVVWGRGFGAEGQAVGEVCFHTAMTGYQEIMTDPSFAGQIITFTFPHIGNVGANPDDVEADRPHALGMIVREDVTAPSNFRAVERLDGWMKRHARIGLSGIDTRALTRRIRTGGAPTGVVAHAADGVFDLAALVEMARGWPGLEGMDLAKEVSTATHYGWEGGVWRLGFGYGAADSAGKPHVVAIDYGSKHNIFRNLALAGARVSVVPATASFEDMMALEPDGFFLSNGPGDPAATGAYAVPVIRAMLETGKPLFGICLGHQLLGLAVGATTTKMFQGHRGANHPVKRLLDGAVEITSMNHGFAVERESLPAGVTETHVSLFDGSNAGLELDGGRAFSVQYHPEASPGPQDSMYLFERFVEMLGKVPMLPPEDTEVLDQLKAAGDNHNVERPVKHWFFGDEADLHMIAASLASAGWYGLDPRQDEDGWLMSPTKNTDLSQAAVLQMNAEVASASGELEVTYDGWETSVEQAN